MAILLLCVAEAGLVGIGGGIGLWVSCRSARHGVGLPVASIGVQGADAILDIGGRVSRLLQVGVRWPRSRLQPSRSLSPSVSMTEIMRVAVSVLVPEMTWIVYGVMGIVDSGVPQMVPFSSPNESPSGRLVK